MATRDENAEDPNSCWNRAEEEEQMFVLLGRDRHAPALIRLWAEMREKEGEDADVVEEARACAQMMEDAGVADGRTYLSLDAVASFTSTLKQPVTPVTAPAVTADGPSNTYGLKIGDVVVAGRGRPAKLVKIFDERDYGHDDKINKELVGMANIHVPGSKGPVTVQFDMLRRALPEEVEAYQNVGGRL